MIKGFFFLHFLWHYFPSLTADSCAGRLTQITRRPRPAADLSQWSIDHYRSFTARCDLCCAYADGATTVSPRSTNDLTNEKDFICGMVEISFICKTITCVALIKILRKKKQKLFGIWLCYKVYYYSTRIVLPSLTPMYWVLLLLR